MSIPTSPQTLFDLGFEHGVEAGDDPSIFEMSSRVLEYRLGYVLGRSCSVCVQKISRREAACVAGALAARFDVPLKDILAAMVPQEEHVALVRDAYSVGGKSR